MTRSSLCVVAFLVLTGCAGIGPGAIHRTRLSYNETVKTTSEQEMLLNIVRLRYGDTPSALAISNIAAQYELSAGVGANPFFAAGADRSFTSVLPQANLGGADRPTISLTPLDDTEFARRLFTPLTLEGVVYLARTTWPIGTVFRLYLENLNWVPNAQTASGPTPALAPPGSAFNEGARALNVLQQRGDIVFGSEPRVELLGPPLPTLTAQDLIAATQQGLEFAPQPDGKSWRLQRSTSRFVLHVNPAALASAEMATLRRAFRLKDKTDHFDLTIESMEPFAVPPEGTDRIDLEPRSLLQALFFVAHGVQVPREHLERGLARQTLNADGTPFDWAAQLAGLFSVKSVRGPCAPEEAHVAVEYAGACFFIEASDHETKSTFSLLMEHARLELSGKTGQGAPLLTIPLGR
ncbi:MAG: hypothetical protein ACOZQL_08860 [Myxococcota bacterium]